MYNSYYVHLLIKDSDIYIAFYLRFIIHVGCIHPSHQYWAKSRRWGGERDWFNSCSTQLAKLLLHTSPLPQAVATETRHTKNSHQVSVRNALVMVMWWSCDNHMICLISRVVVAVLDNFHFDLSLAQSLRQDGGIADNEQRVSSQSFAKEDIQPACKTGVKRGAEDNAGLESEESQEEQEMEEEEKEEEEEEGSESIQEEIEKSEGDLAKQRAVAQKIYKVIVNSILPSLEGVLTKRVSSYGSWTKLHICIALYGLVRFVYMQIHCTCTCMYMYLYMKIY